MTLHYFSLVPHQSGHQVLHDSLDALHQRSLQNGFTFSASKSVNVHFCRHRSCPRDSQFLDNVSIPTAASVRYLGMIFELNLCWKKHISKLKWSRMQKMNLLCKLAHSTYGVDTISLVRTYRTILQSSLDYGAVAHSSASTSVLSTLNIIQHIALRLSCEAYTTTPSISILIDLGEIPLTLHCQYLLAAYYLRAQSSPYLPSSQVFQSSSGTSHRRGCVMIRLQAIAEELGLPLHWPVVTESAVSLPPWKSPSFWAVLTPANPSSNLLVTLDALLAKHANKPIYNIDGSKIASSLGCVVMLNSTVLLPYFLLPH